jgi:hypothetical protein
MANTAEFTRTTWPLRWSSVERGTWAADRNGRVVGEVRRDSGAYVATRGNRRVGRYATLPEALDAVDHAPFSAARPARAWTLLLAGINVAIIGSLMMLGTVILR